MELQNDVAGAPLHRIVLLPCPFCGDEVDVEQHAFNKRYYAECRCTVECCTEQFETPYEVAKAWNKRRSTGLVNWLVAEMEKAGETSYMDKRYQALRDCRKMVRRLLGQ